MEKREQRVYSSKRPNPEKGENTPMVKALDFHKGSIGEALEEIKERFWEDSMEYTRGLLKTLLEKSLEEERERYVGAGWHEPGEERVDYRNGYYVREVVTGQGLLRGVRVPRVRKKGLRYKVLERYRRYRPEVEEQVLAMYVRGISTRQVGPVLERLLGAGVSAATVSRIARRLDAQVREFHQRPLEDRYLYLVLDGIHMKIKSPLGVQSRVVLCAVGIQENGKRELIDFRLMRSESGPAWEGFLNNLYRRGLTGERLRLIVTDGGTGMLAGVSLVYPWPLLQRCWVHKLRNVAVKLPRKLQAACLRELKAVYQAGSVRQACEVFQHWKQTWLKVVPKAVACVEQDLDSLLAFLACPPQHWKTIRTTNLIERLFREVRRRTRPMSCFNHDFSCERVMYAVLSHQNAKWENAHAF